MAAKRNAPPDDRPLPAVRPIDAEVWAADLELDSGSDMPATEADGLPQVAEQTQQAEQRLQAEGPDGPVPVRDSPELERGDREERIRQAAYHAAERRGFAPGHELEDWLAAEQEIGKTD